MTARRIPVPLAVAAASVPMFMATLDNLVVTTALPAIHDALGANLEQLQWVTNAYTLSFAALMLFAVGLGDRYGRRTVFISGIVIFAAASAAGGLSTTIGGLILARAVQGIGAAAVLPLSLTLLAGAVPARGTDPTARDRDLGRHQRTGHCPWPRRRRRPRHRRQLERDLLGQRPHCRPGCSAGAVRVVEQRQRPSPGGRAFTAAAQPAIIVGAAVVGAAALLALLLPGRAVPAAERALPASTVAEGIGTAPTTAAA